MREVKIRTQHGVGEDLILSHLNMTDGNTQAQNLLELELDSRADLDDLVGQVFSVRDGGGELASYDRGLVSCVDSSNQCTYPSRDRGRGDEESA